MMKRTAGAVTLPHNRYSLLKKEAFSCLSPNQSAAKKDLENLANYYYRRGELRNYVLVVLGSSTALRISDLLKLRWEDVYDFTCGKCRDHVTLTEQKTK